jgi:gamma-glutamyltranspeptidase / glutathione hydrolase
MAVAPAPVRTSHRPPIQARHVAAASGHYLATEAAMRILRRGGNAIDAGVAAGICIDVLLPDLCNFGGVAPLIVFHKESGDLVSISGLGPWGRAANMQHFLEEEGGDIPVGVKRSVVPGAPDAWLTALARYGKLTFAEVVQPAIELCEGGFVVYPSLHRNIAKEADGIARWDSTAAIFLPAGSAPAPGEILYQHDLANTFRRMVAAEERASGRGRAAAVEAARDEFYRGDIGKQIAAFIQQEGGFIDEQDLADFHSDIETPVSTTYRGVEVYACGPWSQGPVIPQVLNMLEGQQLRELGHNSADYIHLFAEAFNLAFADRERYYGDPHVVDVPLERLLSKPYAAERVATIDPARAFGEMPNAGVIEGYIAYSEQVVALSDVALQPDTSYVCVIDADGNAFSATPSDGIGSTPIVPGLGLVCSGRGSQSWLIPGHASALAGGKRPRLTPNPAMAFRDGQLYMPFGTPGADMQPQSMLQTFVNVVDFGMDVQQAIEAPRFGTFSYPESFWPHTYRPGRLNLEARIPRAVGDDLAARGHDVEWWPEWTRIAGNVCAILNDPTRRTLTAGADARAEAYAAGW